MTSYIVYDIWAASRILSPTADMQEAVDRSRLASPLGSLSEAYKVVDRLRKTNPNVLPRISVRRS